jgi:hypothetical protein
LCERERVSLKNRQPPRSDLDGRIQRFDEDVESTVIKGNAGSALDLYETLAETPSSEIERPMVQYGLLPGRPRMT